MKFTVAAAAAGLLGLTSARPAPLPSTDVAAKTPPNGYGADFKFPLQNGFPNPSTAELAKIQKTAGGTLPNDLNPPNPGATGALDLMVIATNELHEVAFFTELLYNITNGVSGYDASSIGLTKAYLVDTITAIKAQEELHALSANSALEAFGYDAVQPCAYTYPVTTLKDAIVLASTFTDLVLGALQSVVADMATLGNAPLAQFIASVIGEEAEQEGFFRFSQSKVPASAPFLTNSNGIFAYNAVSQLFIVPGSCPTTLTQVPVLGALSVMGTPKDKNSTLTFSITGTLASGSCITYMSGQENYPVTVPITGAKTSGGMTTFSASFPYAGGFSRGLTVAAVTGPGPYANNTAVAMSSTYGPGLIEVD